MRYPLIRIVLDGARASLYSHYLPGVGVVVGGVGAGAVSAGVDEGAPLGELSGFGEGDAFALVERCVALARCLVEPVEPPPAFSSVLPVFSNPFPTVRSVA
jgi:hypothetical protein